MEKAKTNEINPGPMGAPASEPAKTPRKHSAKRPVKIVKKTYGVRGLMEWKISLPTGSLILPYIDICFEGGQITGYGVAPARYSTSDSFIQGLIETSQWFKAGRIVILRSHDS